MNAATERHVNTKLDDDLSTTQDPRMSTEAPAEGTSAECAEMTTVVLESTPHELQDQLQDSLQASPYACEQEAADSIVAAGRMNGMVEMAKPTGKLDVDVNGKATLGRELVGMAHRVDKGSKEHEPQSQLQQMEFYCKESCQHNTNTNKDIPSAQKLPLEGEWIVCVSGEIGYEGGTDGRACIDEAEEADQVPAECCQQLGTADGNPS